MTDTQTKTFDEAFNDFIKIAQDKVDEGYKDHPFPNPIIEFSKGGRYIRVIKSEYVDGDASKKVISRSAFCFVDKTNGNILKAAGWKAPAKGARGSIFNKFPGAAITQYGAIYAR